MKDGLYLIGIHHISNIVLQYLLYTVKTALV